MSEHTPEVRSYNMSQIRSKDTKPESITRKYLYSQGFRYKKNVENMPGKPDIVLPKYRVCIFVNGCFWHMHEGCKYFVWPRNNAEFWKKKLEENAKRDHVNHEELIRQGWRVFVIWECMLKKEKAEETLSELVIKIKRTGSHIEGGAESIETIKTIENS